MAANARSRLLMAPVYVAAAVGRIAASMFRGATRDGTLAAAFRQGADEIGAALKAFPDAIQTLETGSILNPTQAEVTNSRKTHAMQVRAPDGGKSRNLPSAGEIAREGTGGVHGQQASKERMPSAGDIARDNSKQTQQENGQQNGPDRSCGRD